MERQRGQPDIEGRIIKMLCLPFLFSQWKVFAWGLVQFERGPEGVVGPEDNGISVFLILKCEIPEVFAAF